ncbi:MAG: major facilitator superfamily 1, partial [Actinobacteria bacterium]|nr:major facilitator superfamily 1 [Actinomycetota bacterium]
MPSNGSSSAIASTFRALRHRNFRLWFYGQLTSLVGTWMQTIAQNWLVYQLTGSAWDLGLVNFVGAIPLVPLTLYAGVIADRFSKRRIIFLMQAAMMALAFILAALCFTGVVRVWHVMVLAFLLGAAQALDTPARQAFVIELVGKEDLSNAIALNSGIFHGARVIGPAVAGILVA